jgi:hypothetical protein
MFFVTSSVLTAVAQMVNASRTPARAGRVGGGRSSLEVRKEFESSGAAHRRIPCDQVISRVDHDPNVKRGRAVDMLLVSRELGTSVTWVGRCMRAYGRRVKRPGVESAEATEQRLESYEEDEPREVQPEDIEEEGGELPEPPPEEQSRQKNAPLPTPKIP